MSVQAINAPLSSFPRKREPGTPRRFASIAAACVYWIPAYAGMTIVRV
jgi:hypothetical protein